MSDLPTASVVVRSRDEADRLRLTLCSLAQQTMAAEIVVVDDGSRDHTQAVLADAAREVPLTVITHANARGRAGAANAGAAAARGDVLLFLDGDTLIAPDTVLQHVRVHAQDAHAIGRGECFHLRATRFLLDPEACTPRAGEDARIARATDEELARMRITRAQIVDDFDGIHRRGEPGIYPGSGPRMLHDLEWHALNEHARLQTMWIAASGSNMSMRRDAFDAVGGFNPHLDINEHRELALRLCQNGGHMAAVKNARTYHMTHRSGWRDPLQDTQWERVFYREHPLLAVKLLAVFWATIADDRRIPEPARIRTLAEFDIAARGNNGIDYDAVRRLIPGLSALGVGVTSKPGTLASIVTPSAAGTP